MDIPPSESGHWRCDETINTDRFIGPVASYGQLWPAVSSYPCAPAHPPNHLLGFPKSGLAEPAGVTSSVPQHAEGTVPAGRTDG